MNISDLSGAGKCFSTRDWMTPLDVETKSVSSSSRCYKQKRLLGIISRYWFLKQLMILYICIYS